MEESARQALTGDVRRAIFELLDVGEVVDLGGFENFVYSAPGRIIRITHAGHRSAAELEAEIAFIEHLAAGGASVARPLPLPGGELLVTVGEFHIVQFEQAPGSKLPAEPYPDDLVKAWGHCIGGFHALAMQDLPLLERDSWRDDANHRFDERIPPAQQDVLRSAAALMESLEHLPQNDSVFGMIHSDAHPGNFHVSGTRITMFDFDDCLYAWYGYDVATILFGVLLRPWVEEDRDSQSKAATHFLQIFLEGYREVCPLETLMFEKMPVFLKLREFSLYGVVLHHMDSGTEADPYVSRFMKGRRERLAAEVPFLELDFAAFTG